MKNLAIAAAVAAAFSFSINAQPCYKTAKEVAPSMSDAARAENSRNLEIAARNYAADPSPDNLIWYARRKGYLGHYRDAIESLTIGIGKYPNDARMYRHRGHRFITLRCFDDAIRDFETAAKLVKGKPDEVEPDGEPNAKNIATGSLQSNIWYHLGLAYYLKGDFKRAIAAYKAGMKVSNNNDKIASTLNWYYISLRRIGKDTAAAKLLEPINADFEVIENVDHLRLLRLYRGDLKPEQLLGEVAGKTQSAGNATLSYGLGAWYFHNGDKGKAMEIFRKITAGNQWASFGYIAAEVDLARQPR